MTETEKLPIGRQPPPAWMVAPTAKPSAPVPQALAVALAVLPGSAAAPPVAPPIIAPLPAPPIETGPAPRARTSGVETDPGQARPWNRPDWK